MTRCQRDALLFIETYIDRQGISPSYAEIRAHMGIRSSSGVNRVVRALVEQGYLETAPGRARRLRVLRPAPKIAAAGSAAVYPRALTAALRDVLGMPNFKAHEIWMALREVGQVIPTRYEDEMAAALHFLIPIAIEHGDDWQPAAARALLAMQAAHLDRGANDA